MAAIIMSIIILSIFTSGHKFYTYPYTQYTLHTPTNQLTELDFCVFCLWFVLIFVRRKATGVFLYQLQQKDNQMMDHIDEATALISAAAHDIDHPGRSSAFLCNSNNFLSVLYNDMCVLESHHAALMFKLTLRDEKVNIFKNLDRETYKLVRSIVVDMILATEMTRHFEHLAKFVSVFGTDCDNEVHTDADENHMLIRRMLIKCADVSNPARPFGYCVEWAGR